MNKEPNNDTKVLISQIKTYEDRFITLIRHRLGLVIHTHQTNELLKTILGACQTFNCNAEEYLLKITTEPLESPLLEHLIVGITISETYFFRDKHQIELLQKTLLPQLIQARRDQKTLSLRIWSAGCSTGEEIYTLGMLLKELLPDFSAWQLQLLGTDLNTYSLKKAMVGHYTEWSMRAISPYFKQSYFSYENNHYVLNETIRKLVHFDYLNLNDDTYPALFNRTNAQDLILCRNVLIYFDNARISNLMKKLNNSLVPGGYLLLGASDPIMREETDLIFHHQLGIVFSRPRLEDSPVNSTISSTASTPITRLHKQEISTTKHHITNQKHLVHPAEIPKVTTQNLTNITKLLTEHRWKDVLEAIDNDENSGKKDSTLLNLKATAYANLGQLDQSLQSCLDSLRLDATNKVTYFTFALTLLELNRVDEAETALRKTLFLDREFVAGHFQLGLLLLKKKQYVTGMKSLTNALTIAESKKSSDPVPGYSGLNYGKLSDIFKHEIEMYSSLDKK